MARALVRSVRTFVKPTNPTRKTWQRKRKKRRRLPRRPRKSPRRWRSKRAVFRKPKPPRYRDHDRWWARCLWPKARRRSDRPHVHTAQEAYDWCTWVRFFESGR